MKTGVIVYVAGGDSIHPDENIEAAVSLLNISADRLEVISPNSGHFDVLDAWLSMTVKGMQRIICVIAELTGMGNAKLTGRELRLCG